MDYKDKLRLAKEALDSGSYDKETIEYIFPELAESEDEKIRKKVIDVLKLNVRGAESQMQASRGIDRTFEVYACNKVIAWLEKQGGQKPAMIQWKGDNLKEIVDFTGVYKEGFEKWFHNSWKEYEKYVHEHGDIFKIFNEDGSHMEVPVGAWIIKAPDGYNTASRFAISPILTEISIESNFKFKKAIECVENYVNSFPHSQRPEIWQHINFLKSFRERVQPQPKQEWSEEDRIIRNALIKLVEMLYDSSIYKSDKNRLLDWLKSLKDRYTWKPSEEQLEAVRIAAEIGTANDSWAMRVLEELYTELKKLKG